MTNSLPRPAAALASLAFLLCGAALEARVVSYAPLTPRPAIPAVQRRTNRHALLVEQTASVYFMGAPTCLSCNWAAPARLVLHDSAGLEEPRDVTPGGDDAGIVASAAREEVGLPPALLAQLLPGAKPNSPSGFLISPDGGTTWLPLALPASGAYTPFSTDTGGPFVRARGSSIRIGTRETPFFLALYETATQQVGLWDVSRNGNVARRTFFSGDSSVVGMDAEGQRALVAGTPGVAPGPGGSPATRGLYVVNPDGTVRMLTDLRVDIWVSEGWITPDGRAYVEANLNEGSGTRHAVLLHGRRRRDGNRLRPQPERDRPLRRSDGRLFRRLGPPARRGPDGPVASLALHGTRRGVARRDAARSRGVAPGASGRRLLVQVHRPRPQVDQRVFRDPALAVWEVGTPAPSSYDELFVNEQSVKAFVHVDPDIVGQGEPFLFDSGSPSLAFFPAGPSGASGGADVIQEWGVVRGSLKQRLVIPATARADGINGSRWRTDVVLRNSDSAPVAVAVRFLPNPATGLTAADANVTLPSGATLIQKDVLGSLFSLDAGAGALLLTPENGRSITATSRTYTSTHGGLLRNVGGRRRRLRRNRGRLSRVVRGGAPRAGIPHQRPRHRRERPRLSGLGRSLRRHGRSLGGLLGRRRDVLGAGADQRPRLGARRSAVEDRLSPRDAAIGRDDRGRDRDRRRDERPDVLRARSSRPPSCARSPRSSTRTARTAPPTGATSTSSTRPTACARCGSSSRAGARARTSRRSL